jgi:CheY-like chemotaxis protein
VKPRKPTILIVDDSNDGREMLVEYLAFRGFDVVEARHGAEAIEMARQTRPTVILMDLTMPGVDGWEATRQIKSTRETANATVVAVSAHAFPLDEASARAAGCDAFVPKPFDLTALGDALVEFRTKGIAALNRKFVPQSLPRRRE